MSCRMFYRHPLYTAARRVRSFSTVQLDYDKVSGGSQTPLVILHGLLGSKQNWRSWSKIAAQDLGRDVYTLDLRNHGQSPHASPMDYKTMANDVTSFVKNEGLDKAILLGHSMGGKVAMTCALDADRSLYEKVIVGDIAPQQSNPGSEFHGYVEILARLSKARPESRKEAQQMVMKEVPDRSVALFLLTNIKPADGYYDVQVGLKEIQKAIPDIFSFPWAPGETQSDIPALFVKGLDSAYINKHNVPTLGSFFPNNALVTVQGGHWVHVSAPEAFREAAYAFIKNEPLDYKSQEFRSWP